MYEDDGSSRAYETQLADMPRLSLSYKGDWAHEVNVTITPPAVVPTYLPTYLWQYSAQCNTSSADRQNVFVAKHLKRLGFTIYSR